MDHAAPRSAGFAAPLHGILLAFPVALYASALAADIAYLNTAEIQWTNFAQWLIAGAALFAGLVFAWALIGFFFGRHRRSRGGGLIYLLVVAAMLVLGIVNSFQHARDGWHSVGTLGVALSVVCTLLAFVAAYFAYGRSKLENAR